MAKVVSLASEKSVGFFEMADNIASMHAADPTKLRDLPELTGMSRRRLYYLLDVGRLIANGQISRSEAEAIGWTKLQIIARHILDEGMEGVNELRPLLEIAKETNARSLPKKLLGQKSGDTKAVVFHLTKSQRAELREALQHFGARLGHRGLQHKDRALTGLVKAGVDLPTIQRISGHKTLAMVLRYTQLTDDHIDDSVAKLDGAFSDAITPELHTGHIAAVKGAA